MALKVDMRILFVSIIIASLNAYSNAQFDSDGVWECINRPSIEQLPHIGAFPFWMKFRGTEVLISNSNNSYLSARGEYTYMKGTWEVKTDTLLVHISDTRQMSTHTGVFRDQIDDSNRFKPHDYIFSIEYLSNKNILLTPLNDFLGYSPDGAHAGMPYTFKLGVNEKLSLVKTDKSYYFNEKL